MQALGDDDDDYPVAKFGDKTVFITALRNKELRQLEESGAPNGSLWKAVAADGAKLWVGRTAYRFLYCSAIAKTQFCQQSASQSNSRAAQGWSGPGFFERTPEPPRRVPGSFLMLLEGPRGPAKDSGVS